MRAEAEARLVSLLSAPVDVFAYASWMTAARDQDVLVPTAGPPIWRGQVLSVSTGEANQRAYLRIGAVAPFGVSGSFYSRKPGEWYGLSRPAEDCAGWLDPRVEAELPAEPGLPDAIRALAKRAYARGWRLGVPWTVATPAEQDHAWPILRPELVTALTARAPREGEKVPVVLHGALVLVDVGGALREAIVDGGELLAPTQAGWTDLLQLSPDTEYTHTQVASVASEWWGLTFPRGHLARERAARGRTNASEEAEQEPE